MWNKKSEIAGEIVEKRRKYILSNRIIMKEPGRSGGVSASHRKVSGVLDKILFIQPNMKLKLNPFQKAFKFSFHFGRN